ncbi:MAG TPA: hypothetical protein VE198_08200 [Actinoallomurus sp.]|jgi:hypothetical protein|nr:hypothetical protein [Actinoallomurus sp.]
MRLNTGGSGPGASTVRVTVVVAVFPSGGLVAGGFARPFAGGRRDRAWPPDLEAVGVPAVRGSAV